MATLIAKITIDPAQIEAVKNLVAEADMAAQILEGEEQTPVIAAVKDGLRAGLDGLTPKE